MAAADLARIDAQPSLIEQVQRELAVTRESLPIVSMMASLFTDPKMFGSYTRFEDAGFSLVAHAPHKMMAGKHKRAKGYFFKKYNNDHDSEKQLVNYLRRIEGSRLIRTFIADHGFTRVIAPKKWLYELPTTFPERYLLVAERVDLATRDETHRRYARISTEQLQELATVLYYFRGLNSTAANLPYTKEGQIAFIDTERWHHDKDLLRKVGDRLPRARVKQAKAVFKELRNKGATPFVSAFG